jgi:hypothetical protein
MGEGPLVLATEDQVTQTQGAVGRWDTADDATALLAHFLLPSALPGFLLVCHGMFYHSRLLASVIALSASCIILTFLGVVFLRQLFSSTQSWDVSISLSNRSQVIVAVLEPDGAGNGRIVGSVLVWVSTESPCHTPKTMSR